MHLRNPDIDPEKRVQQPREARWTSTGDANVARNAAKTSMMTPPTTLPPGFDSPEHFLSAIIDSSDDAIITKDLNGIVTSWNKGAERIFGYTAEEMIGQPILRLIPDDRKEEEPAILQRLRSGERVDHFDTKRRHKDGHELDISLTISPVKNRAGEIVGASKIARDISLQKQAARILATASDETVRQNRLKDEFLTTLSHELRTPLQSIVGWVQILQGGDLAEGELAQGLEVIGRNAKAQQHIIEDLLDMSRILSGKVRLDVQKIELGTVLEAALETVRPAAQAKGVKIHAVIDPVASPDLRGSAAHATGLLEPAQQCDQVHAARRAHRSAAAAGELASRGEHHGYRDRHCQRFPAARFRPIPPGRCVHRPEPRRAWGWGWRS